MFIFCFFFFQAEDGIRDLTVTGVQTCALPISNLAAGAEVVDGVIDNGDNLCPGGKVCFNGYCLSKEEAGDAAAAMEPVRSEERRVGKEWRCRWGPYA